MDITMYSGHKVPWSCASPPREREREREIRGRMGYRTALSAGRATAGHTGGGVAPAAAALDPPAVAPRREGEVGGGAVQAEAPA